MASLNLAYFFVEIGWRGPSGRCRCSLTASTSSRTPRSTCSSSSPWSGAPTARPSWARSWPASSWCRRRPPCGRPSRSSPTPSPPDPLSLALTAGGAIVVNTACALLLARMRAHGSSMSHAAYLAARNDVIGNALIIAMAATTAWTRLGWPDIVLGHRHRPHQRRRRQGGLGGRRGGTPGGKGTGGRGDRLMRAVLYREYGAEPRLEDLPPPPCPDDGVVIDVRATGVCRSDWHAWQGHDPVTLPHVPGHEFAGVVVAGRGAGHRAGTPGTASPFPSSAAVAAASSALPGRPRSARTRPSRASPAPARSPSRWRCTPRTSTWSGCPRAWTTSPPPRWAAGSPPPTVPSRPMAGCGAATGWLCTAAEASACPR